MRAWPFLLTLAVMAGTTGCKLLNGYFVRGEHFPFGTTGEEGTEKSVKRVFDNFKIVLHEQNFSLKEAKCTEESAQIHAVKDGLNTIIDITSVGEGAKIKVEIDQAGNDKMIWSLFNEFRNLP